MAKKVKVEIRTGRLDELKPNDKNPRQISSKGFKALKKSLKDFPEMLELREIVVDEDYQILAGHQRYYALKDLGETETVIKRVIGLTPKQKREFMAKDNNNNGQWDQDKVFNIFSPEELEEWDVNLGELKSPELGEIDAAPTERKPKTIVCPECGAEFEE